MPEPTLVAGGLMTLLEGAGYLVVAALLAARSVSPDLRLGSRLFQGWWAGIGANKVLAGLVGLGATFGLVDGPAYVAVLHLNLVLLVASLWCLTAYFAFLYTGTTRGFGALAATCALYLLFPIYNLTAAGPTGFGLGRWRTYHTVETPSPAWRSLVLLATMVVLAAGPAIAHLRLLLRLEDPAQRYRVALVSFGIVLWTVSVVFVAFPNFDTSALRQVASRAFGLVGALLALWAYRPPAWVARRLAPSAPVTAGGRA